MAIQLYNSLTRSKDELTTLVDGEVSMYVCGPTVYDDCHIGHLMGPILFDVIARWLRVRGYRVRFVNNITDIDDKIINRARESGEDWRAIAERYSEQYFGFLRLLGIDTISEHPRCTEFIPEMIQYIEDLVARDRAYVATDGVYYEVAKQGDYGCLSGRRVEDMQSGARIEAQAGLRHAADFCLWKFAKPDEPHWDSPWGAGRPGWHIECSVMSSSLLGDSFDIHGGGDDLKFPHHENEIAQGRAHGGDYAHYWMHNGLIQYEGAKISKSDPRNKDPAFAGQFKAAALLEKWGAATLRFFILRGHYRRPFDFAPSEFASAQQALGRLHQQLGELLDEPAEADLAQILGRELPAELARRRDQFVRMMDDDFNTGAAIGHCFAIAAWARKQEGSAATAGLLLLRDLGRLIGLFRPGDRAETAAPSGADRTASGAADELADGLMRLVIELRQGARERRDFATADRVRDALAELGIALTDGKDGTSWSRR